MLTNQQKIYRLQQIVGLLLQFELVNDSIGKNAANPQWVNCFYICHMYNSLYRGNLEDDIPEIDYIKNTNRHTHAWLTDDDFEYIPSRQIKINLLLLLIEILKDAQ